MNEAPETKDDVPEGWRRRVINRGAMGGKCPLPGDKNWLPHDGNGARKRRLRQLAAQEEKAARKLGAIFAEPVRAK